MGLAPPRHGGAKGRPSGLGPRDRGPLGVTGAGPGSAGRWLCGHRPSCRRPYAPGCRSRPARRLSEPRAAAGSLAWPGLAWLGGTCRGLCGAPRSCTPRWDAQESGTGSRDVGCGTDSAFLSESGEMPALWDGVVSRPSERVGKRLAGARGTDVGSWTGTASCWCKCGRNPLFIARGPHPRSPPVPCHCSLRALGPRQPGRALPTSSPRTPSTAVLSQSSHLLEHGSTFVYLSTFALAVSRAWSCLQVLAQLAPGSSSGQMSPLTPGLPRLPSFIP